MAFAYNNQRPSFRDRIAGLLPRRTEYKDAPYAVVPGYNSEAQWRERNAANYIREGYKVNSAVFACLKTLATGIAEAPMRCYTDETRKKVIPTHPIRALLERPNDQMGEAEFWKYFVTYAGIGGNGYGRMVPYKNRGAFTPAEIWPYHDVVMWPQPRGKQWVAEYQYSLDNGMSVDHIPPEEVIHFKWSVDPEFPWRGMSPLQPVAREVDTDSELIRYIKVLLQNDAVTRGVLTWQANTSPVTDARLQQIKQEWRLKFGGNSRGEIAVLPPGMQYERIALNLNELAAETFQGQGEARIAAAYNIPPLIVGLGVGLREGREGNWESTRKHFTEGTLCTLWAAIESSIQHRLVPLMGNDCVVGFDLSRVRALQYLDIERRAEVLGAFEKGVPIRLNEMRALYGYEKVPGGDVFAFRQGRNGVYLASDIEHYMELQEQLKLAEVEGADKQNESLDIQNEAAAAQLNQAGEEGDGADGSEGEPGVDNVILAEAA